MWYINLDGHLLASHYNWLFMAWLIGDVIVDLTMALWMCFFLLRLRTGFRR